jgi:hypothetical protein
MSATGALPNAGVARRALREMAHEHTEYTYCKGEVNERVLRISGKFGLLGGASGKHGKVSLTAGLASFGAYSPALDPSERPVLPSPPILAGLREC